MDDVGCNDYWMMTCTDTIILLMVAKCIVESTADRSESIMDGVDCLKKFLSRCRRQICVYYLSSKGSTNRYSLKRRFLWYTIH